MNYEIAKHINKPCTDKQRLKLYDKGISIPKQRTYLEAQYILQGGSPDEYKHLLIKIRFDNKNLKGCEITARSRGEARKLWQWLEKQECTNITFKTYECY